MADQTAERKMEAYLGSLRQRLRGMDRENAREIEVELRTHIKDKASANGAMTSSSVEAALTALGSPDEIAREYLSGYMKSRRRVLGGLFRRAGLSIAGLTVLLGLITGYFTGALLILCAILKPFHPHAAGLWLLGDDEFSLRLGFGNPPGNGKDLLGWWIVPVGFAIGCVLVTLTTRFALWCTGQYRKSLA